MPGSKTVLKSPISILLLWWVGCSKSFLKKELDTASLWEGAYRHWKEYGSSFISRSISVSDFSFAGVEFFLDENV